MPLLLEQRCNGECCIGCVAGECDTDCPCEKYHPGSSCHGCRSAEKRPSSTISGRLDLRTVANGAWASYRTASVAKFHGTLWCPSFPDSDSREEVVAVLRSGRATSTLRSSLSRSRITERAPWNIGAGRCRTRAIIDRRLWFAPVH